MRKLLKTVVIAAVLIFTACDRGGGSGGSDKSGEKSLADQIEELEKSGKLPKLDRTDTIAGIDNNGNGIRDDIEVYIEKTYTDEKQKKAVTQYAKASQAILLIEIEDKEAIRKAADKRGDAFVCLADTFEANPNAENPYVASDKIKTMTLNTKTRIKKYLKADQALNGTSWSYPQGDTCE